MPRPVPPATAPDHELHDALLVAQFAAGDPLDRDRQREAEWLVDSCGACASLAADLHAVSGAVAWEPVPPRRRDFRISPEQAEQLRGNALTRLMRQLSLSLPQSKALRPAAAGLMSLGLLFVVAGAVWPGGSSQFSKAEPASAPSGITEERLTQTAPSFEAGPPALSRPQAGAAAQTEDAAALELFADDGTAEPGTKSNAARKAVSEADEAGLEPAAALGAAAPDQAQGAAPESLGTESEANTERVGRETDAAAVEVPRDAVVEPIAASSSEAVPRDVPGIATVLATLGVALAIGGAALLLLAWLARRSADPLLR